MLTRRILFSAVSAFTLFISGCRIETPPVTITVDGDPTSSTTASLSCAATLSNSVTSVISSQAIPVILQVAGGTGPYTYNLVTGNFSSQLTLSETFTNSGTTSSVQSRTYTITDTQGNSTQCTLSVSVLPTLVTSTDPLACAFTANPTSPAVGQLVNLGVTATGGTAPYTASNYAPGLNTTYASTLSQVTSSTWASTAIYGTSGLKTASVQITDNAGSVTTCSQVINVAPSPSVTVTATPSATVTAGTPITLSAVANNFGSTPEITFSTTSGGVTFTAVGNTIVVQTTDYSARTIIVDVVASTATQQASASITLTFTGSQALTCNLTYPASDYYKVGDEITFSVSATSGTALAITSISAQDGTVLDSIGSSSVRIRFNSTGYKTVYATARAVTSGTLCNNGATLTSTVYINPNSSNLSCSAVTSPNPSAPGEFFLARAVVPSGAGVGTVRLALIQTGKNTQSPYNHAQTSYSYYNDATSSYFAIYTNGSYPIVLTVRDEAGNTATCSTTQVVNW